MNTPTQTQGGELRGILCRVGTPSEPDPITGYPRILISTDPETLQEVKRLPMLEPVVVIEESAYATLHAQIARMKQREGEAITQLDTAMDVLVGAGTLRQAAPALSNIRRALADLQSVAKEGEQ